MFDNAFRINVQHTIALLCSLIWLHMLSFSVGDAMCAVAATTSFPEPFVSPPGAKRLSYKHRNFAGNRHSDHIAMLQAYQQWEFTRYTIFSCK